MGDQMAHLAGVGVSRDEGIAEASYVGDVGSLYRGQSVIAPDQGSMLRH
ncbi:MAG: hypothetical protein WCL39_13210 [Armatimonadota bacterium]